jgi:hypothetical protein
MICLLAEDMYIMRFVILFISLVCISCSNENDSNSPSTTVNTTYPTASESQPNYVPLESAETDSNQMPDKAWNGYACTVDCSGHEAGHDWAEENAIDDTDDCNGNSNSFNEGCQEYVEENADVVSEKSE